jgi:hypothetical protein
MSATHDLSTDGSNSPCSCTPPTLVTFFAVIRCQTRQITDAQSPSRFSVAKDIIVDGKVPVVVGISSDLLRQIKPIVDTTHRRIRNLVAGGIDSTAKGQWTRVATKAIERLMPVIDPKEVLMTQ